MNVSSSRKKEKLDLSKLSARELLLIGESQTLGSRPGGSGNVFNSSSNTSSNDEGENGVDEMSSDDDDSGSSDSENDWEEVNDQHVEAALQKYDTQSTANSPEKASASASQASQLSSIPDGGLEIVIPQEGVFRKRDKHKMTVEDIVRRAINKERMELQVMMHQTSLLTQIAKGLQLNKAVNSECVRLAIDDQVKGKSLSSKRLDVAKLEKLMKWFRFEMVISKPSMTENLEITRTCLSEAEFLAYQIMERTFLDRNYYVLIFVAFLRRLRIDARLVISITPIPLKPPVSELLRKPRQSKDSEEKSTDAQTKRKSNKEEKNPKSKATMKLNKKGKEPSHSSKKSGQQNTGRKMISSTDDENEDEVKKGKAPLEPPKIGQDMWVEVYITEEEHWISVDVLAAKVICDKHLESNATRPLTYVFGINNENKIKDVTRRYASDWLTGTQKLRMDPEWLHQTLKPYRGKRSARDREEDEYLDQHLLSLPIPKSVSEVKNHPLFVLRRHLLKYEALYPDRPPAVGDIKGELIYSREYVRQLHTRELWMREARVVRIGEKPYKIVKGRPKYDKLSGARLPEVPSELFGRWQTEDYIPPIAQDGKVPRNEWGNVELFTEKLLPQGCVHMRLPGLQRIAKKLDIDCAPAVVGFDFGAGGSRPAFDGFVVCEEFEDTLLDAWNVEQQEKKKREEEKRLQKIYTNWRKLMRGVLIRDNLEKRYKMNLSGKRKSDETQQESKTSSAVKRSKK